MGISLTLGKSCSCPRPSEAVLGYMDTKFTKNCNIHVPTINLPQQNGAHISWYILYHFVTPINVYDKIYYVVTGTIASNKLHHFAPPINNHCLTCIN